MSKTEDATPDGLTALDWVVIVAATVAFAAGLTWLYQQRRPAPPTEDGATP